jgi:hypothetical protein
MTTACTAGSSSNYRKPQTAAGNQPTEAAPPDPQCAEHVFQDDRLREKELRPTLHAFRMLGEWYADLPPY